MTEPLAYQIRIYLSDAAAEVARHDPGNPSIRSLQDALRRHDAAMKCQFDAFAEYVAEAEREGPDRYPLYEWTKATIEDPVKKVKHTKSFALYVSGQEVYAKDKADALEAALRPMVGGDLITRMSRHDTNPANNPQPPSRRE